MSRSQNDRPVPTDLEHIARDGGGFLRSNFRYLDKAEMLPSRNRFLFLMYDLLDSLPLGGDYFAQVRALREAAQQRVKEVAAETCGLLPADFRLFAEAVGGTGLEQRERMGEQLLALFTGLLVAELRSDRDTHASLDAFFQLLMKKQGMAPGKIASHTLHRIHSRLLYDQSDWIKGAAATFGDIYTCYRDRSSFYIVITPECDLEPHFKKGVRVSPKANSVVLLRGEVRDERPPDDGRDDVVVTPLIVDPRTEKVGWIYWQLRAPLIVPRDRLAAGSRRFAKWGRLRVQEAEEIQMRYATDLLAVGTDDLADRVEKRKVAFWLQKKDKLIRVEEPFHILEIVNPKRRKDIYWALSEDCERFLCPDGDPVVPARAVVGLRCYQPKKDFIERLRPYGVGVFSDTMTATGGRGDAQTAEGEADSGMMTPQQIPTPGSGINFVQDQQGVGFHAEGDVRGVGQALRFVAIQLGIGNRAQDTFLQRVPERTDLLFVIGHVFVGQFGGFPQADNQRHAFRAAAPVALLVATIDYRRERRFATDVQRTNPFRGIELVARQREVIRRHLSHISLHLARRLNSVAMIQHAARAADFGDLFDGEEDACLVVGPHQGYHGRLARDGRFEVGQFQQAVAVNGQVGYAVALLFQGHAIIQHRGMLDAGGDDVALAGVGLERGGNRGVVALGGARGEDDIPRRRADQFGHLFARRLDHPFELGTEFVTARRIAPLRGEVGHHGVQHFRQNGRGGVMVEVDHHLILATARGKRKARRSRQNWEPSLSWLGFTHYSASRLRTRFGFADLSLLIRFTVRSKSLTGWVDSNWRRCSSYWANWV